MAGAGGFRNGVIDVRIKGASRPDRVIDVTDL
jgi:hypothetical protein